MSRRKQSRPRHVDEGVTALEGADPYPGAAPGSSLGLVDGAATPAAAALEDYGDGNLAVQALKKQTSDSAAASHRENGDARSSSRGLDDNGIEEDEEEDTRISEVTGPQEDYYSGSAAPSPNDDGGRYPNEDEDEEDEGDMNRSNLTPLRCENCGVTFSTAMALADHRTLCGDRGKIFMPYDPPANGFIHNGFSSLAHARAALGDRSLAKDFSDEDEAGDDKEDFDSVDDESRARRRSECDNGDGDDDNRAEEEFQTSGFKRKLGDSSPDVRVKSHIRSDESFILGLRNRMVSSLNSYRERRLDELGSGRGQDDNEDDDDNIDDYDGRDDDEDDKDDADSELGAKRRRYSGDEPEGESSPTRRESTEDPAVMWALKAARRGVFGDVNNVSLEPLAATRAAVSQQSMLDSPAAGRAGNQRAGPQGREGLPDEVNMFRSMLFQLQQQQYMQIQMIQEMRRQLVSSGVDPKLLPADMDLNMMSSEGLASVGAAMSGLQNATAAAQAARNGGTATPSGPGTAGQQLPKGFNFPDLISSSRAFTGDKRRRSSREGSPSGDFRRSKKDDRDGDGARSPPQEKQLSNSDKDQGCKTDTSDAAENGVRYREKRDEFPPPPLPPPSSSSSSLSSSYSTPADLTQKYLNLSGSDLSPFSGLLTSANHQSSSSSLPPLGRNPLEILQEKTAASLSALPLPANLSAMRPPASSSSASTSASSAFLGSEPKPFTSSSSMLNSSALFASSPSLSALQKETDALKPSPILPPITLPMTPEAYKGYIQRGTILERSQYASDDPFFKHKCRFCHKVFGSDSALQIHVRSHTGERPFKCNICGNRFSTKGNLKVHFERHKAKYPHIKMDATPVPEHLDRQSNMMPGFPPTPIPPSVPLPRMPLPPPPPPPPPPSRPPSHQNSQGAAPHHSSPLSLPGTPTSSSSSNGGSAGPASGISGASQGSSMSSRPPNHPPPSMMPSPLSLPPLPSPSSATPSPHPLGHHHPPPHHHPPNHGLPPGHPLAPHHPHQPFPPMFPASFFPHHPELSPFGPLPPFHPHHPLSLALPSSIPLPRDSLAWRESMTKLVPSPASAAAASSSQETSVIRSPRRDGEKEGQSGHSSRRSVSPRSDRHRRNSSPSSGAQLSDFNSSIKWSPSREICDTNTRSAHQPTKHDAHERPEDRDECKEAGHTPLRDGNNSRHSEAFSEHDELDKSHDHSPYRDRTPRHSRSRSRSRSKSRSRSRSPATPSAPSSHAQQSTTPTHAHSQARPPSTHSPRQSPASVISWASLVSSQPPMLTSHPHPGIFAHHPHLGPSFPGLGLPLPGPPASFPLPSPLNPVLPMPVGPRLPGGHSPFLAPPPPPPPQAPHRRMDSPLVGRDHGSSSSPSVFRNSILPTKTIDPSENLEQYMEIERSETSKLEALVKNIEQKITDPNQCVVCHRVLSCKSALQMHYRIHTGERPFKCKICGRSFTTKGNLKTHMGVHRAKPALRMMHQCPVCHKQFTNVLVLQQHIRAHTGGSHPSMMPHLPLLPGHHPHLGWSAHRPSPFGIPRHHPYMGPSPHHPFPPRRLDHPSLDLARHFGKPSSVSPNNRPHNSELDIKRELFPSSHSDIEKQFEEKKSEAYNGVRSGKDEKDERDAPKRPSSGNSNSYDESKRHEFSISKSENESYIPPRSSSAYSAPSFDTPFLPPSFGNTSFDAPLAALEERVKAIDSHQAQTSFEKFRNSMGLGGSSALLPGSLEGHKSSPNSEPDLGSSSKPSSPNSSTAELPPYTSGYSHLFETAREQGGTTCNVCYKTFACRSALVIHYRSHTKQRPYRCEVCSKAFSTKGNLKQHKLTHQPPQPLADVEDSAKTKEDEDADGQSSSSLPKEQGDESESVVPRENVSSATERGDEDDDEDTDELPNEDYPFEEDEQVEGEFDMGLEEYDDDQENAEDNFQGDIDNYSNSSNASPLESHKANDSHESNNNLSGFHNNNGDEDGASNVETYSGVSTENPDPLFKNSGAIKKELPTSPEPLAFSFPPIVKQELENESRDLSTQLLPSTGSQLPNHFKSSLSPTASKSLAPSSNSSGLNTSTGPNSIPAGYMTPSGHHSENNQPTTPSSVPKPRSNGLKHQCMTCMKPFSSASALQIHTRTHTGDKPFKCNVCSKAFTTRGNLKVHMGTHMWNNSPSRRGRRMSIEPPFLMSPHMKDVHPFLPGGFPVRPPPPEFFPYQYPPLPMLNGPGSKMNEISVIQSLGGGLPPLPPLPPHLMQGFLAKEHQMQQQQFQQAMKLGMPTPRDSTDSGRLSVGSEESRKVDKNPEQPRERSKTPPSPDAGRELDLSMKLERAADNPEDGKEGEALSATSRSSSPAPSLSLSIPSSQQLPPHLLHNGTTTTSTCSTPSPTGNSKENSSSGLPGLADATGGSTTATAAAAALDLRNLRASPWVWGALPCHHCGQVFTSQDSLEHHLRTQHLAQMQAEGGGSPHPLKAEAAHPPPPQAKALVA